MESKTCNEIITDKDHRIYKEKIEKHYCKKCNDSMEKKQDKSINYSLFVISLIFIVISIMCNIFIYDLFANIVFVFLSSCIGLCFFYEFIFYKEIYLKCNKCNKCGEWAIPEA